MHQWKLAATALAAQLAAGAFAASAADLDYRAVPGERYGTAYEDPRYADIYGRAPPRYEPYPAPYAERYVERVPVPPEPVYRDRYYEEPGRYAEVLPPAYGNRRGCLPREQIRLQLERDGWHGFFSAEARGDLALVKARRPDGRAYALQVDRCTGDVVDARPLAPQGYGPYADAPRRYGRAY